MTTPIHSYARLPSLIETERLLLRPPRLEDAIDLSELADKDPIFARETLGEEVNSLESNCTAVVRMLAERLTGHGAWWVVKEKSTGRLIGLTGYSRSSAGRGLVSALSNELVGHGLASEAISALARLGPSGLSSLRDEPREAEGSLDSEEVDSGARRHWMTRAPRRRPISRRCA